MPYLHKNSIRYFTFESFSGQDVVHAAITRRGGVSPRPWASLNVGGTVGDEPDRVLENRRRSYEAIGQSIDSVYDVWQVHSNRVVYTDSPRPPQKPHIQADAILTDQPGVTLFMRFADCVPVFLYDPWKKVVGLVHAGWKGTTQGIVEIAVQRMVERYGTNPADLLAGIGPSIGAHHYQVGLEVITQVRKYFSSDQADYLLNPNGDNGKNGVQFDLWNANRLILEKVGVSQIEISNICTACDIEDWYSHRGESGRTGRFGALIALRK